jgi:CheY-like chemotaxis protein
MRQTQKMEAIGRLAGGVAHDFNNLLTAICGYCELALGQLGPADPVVADLREVQAAGERARELTQQLLAFGRRQVLAPTVLDLGAVVRDTERMLHRVIGEDIDLRTILAGELGCVMADAGQMQQVLLNLAINARDAMPAGGTLTIETTDVVLDEIYAQLHPGVRPGPHVMLAVCDTGVGMDAATQAHAFEPFFTTKPVGQGTGLGLASVYGIVKQSGGDIRVHSEPGLGTTFRIYLPRVDAAAAALPLPAPAPAPTGGETILVVEDEQRVRQYAQRVLEAAGYRVLMADGGVQALALAAAPAQVLDLLLTDVVMPGMNGREVAEALLARRPDLRVLFMSGYADNAVVERGLVDVGVALLAKPFSGSELLRRVRDVLDASSARPTTPAEPPAP